MSRKKQANIKLADCLDLIIKEEMDQKEKPKYFESKKWCLDDNLMKKILEVLPDDNLLIEIVAYGERIYPPLQNHFMELEFRGLKLKDIGGWDFGFYLGCVKNALDLVVDKTGLTKYEKIMRLEVELVKGRWFRKVLLAYVTPVISKKVNKKELEKILEGVRKVEEKVWEERGEPVGRDLLLHSVDIYSTKNGEKKLIASYDWEGVLSIYEHNSQKEE